jgi:FixJ family two-component response regulator
MVDRATRALVAVVEDDDLARTAMGRLLAAGGFDAALFESAEAFMDAPPERAPLCVIVDVHLRGMSGLDLQSRLRRTGSAVPIIVTTGYCEPAMQDRAERIGCSAFLWKPVAAEILLNIIDSIASQHA